jgi:acetyl esterase/lipase
MNSSDQATKEMLGGSLNHISAQKDVLLDGQILFASKLKRAGRETYQYTVDHTQHGFLTYGHDYWERVATVLEVVKKALGQYLMRRNCTPRRSESAV